MELEDIFYSKEDYVETVKSFANICGNRSHNLKTVTTE